MTKKRKSFFYNFGDDEWLDLLRRIMRDMEDLWKTMEPIESGFSFRIISNGIHPPELEVKRFGSKLSIPIQTTGKKESVKEKTLQGPRPKHFEEAPYTYNVDPNQVRIEINVEGVESEDNVEMQFGEESVEITIYSPKKNTYYFVALPLPSNTDPEGVEITTKKDKVEIKIPRVSAIK